MTKPCQSSFSDRIDLRMGVQEFFQWGENILRGNVKLMARGPKKVLKK